MGSDRCRVEAMVVEPGMGCRVEGMRWKTKRIFQYWAALLA
jgi:hypothetical protein